LKIVECFVFLLIMSLLYSGIRLAKKRLPEVRKLAAIEAMDEAVGRAAEMGKPIWFGTGLGTMERSDAPEIQAALAIMGRAAELCGKYGVWLQYMTHIPYMVPIARSIIRDGYVRGGRPDMYSDEMVFYTGGWGLDAASQATLIGTSVDYMVRERPAAVMMFGTIHWEIQMWLGAAAQIGAMVLGGSKSDWCMSNFLLSTDYALLGDEIFAASAMISRRPFELGLIEAQDWVKILLFILFIVSAIAGTFALFDYATLITF